MKDQEFYKIYKEYFIEALSVLDEQSEAGKNISNKIDESVSFEGMGQISFSTMIKPDYGHFVFTKSDVLKEQNAYKVCQKYLTEKKYINNQMDEQAFMLNNLSKIANDLDGYRFEESNFEEIYNNVEDYINSDEVKVKCISQLNGFSCDVNEIIIDSQVKIIRYTEKECKEIWASNSRLWMRERFPITPDHFKIEVIRSIKKDVLRSGSWQNELQEILKKALTLLRLFKDSNLKIGSVVTMPGQWVPNAYSAMTGSNEMMFGGNYSFKISELPELVKLWNNLENVDFNNVYPLEIALKRFNFAHERVDVEDRLIDIMIGFETLFSESTTEIRYKISLRTAILIGKNLDERKIIFKLMQVAYDMRSSLVHGKKLEARIRISDPINKEYAIGEIIDLIRSRLSSSIKEFIFLSRSKTHSQILNKLHDSALTAGII